MLTRTHLSRGVSLVEVMIGLAIVAILFALGAPSFGDFMQNSRIRNAAEAIQNGINLARAEAVQRNTNVEFVLGPGSAWTVRCAVAVADTPADADAEPDCPGVGTTPASIQARTTAEGSANVTVATAEVVAATGVAAGAATFTDTLSFNGFGRLNTLVAGNNAVFNISTAAGNCVAAGGAMRCLRVVVTAGGQVRMCDPALPARDPANPRHSDTQAC